MIKQFWLVWNPLKRSPIFHHKNRESAKTEAIRLARNNPGQAFYVLEPVCFAMKSDVVVTDMGTGDQQLEAPF